MVKEVWDDGWDKWDSNDAESGAAGGKSIAAGSGEWDEVSDDWGDGWDNDWNDSKKPKATRRTPNPMVGIGGPPPRSFLSKISPKVAMMCGGAVLVLVLIFTTVSFFSGGASTVKEISEYPAGTSGKEPLIDTYAEQHIPSDTEETEGALGINGKESYTTAREAVRVSDLNSKKGAVTSDPEEEDTENAAQEEPEVTLQEEETDETPEEAEVSNEEPETTGLPLEKASFNSVTKMSTGVDTEVEEAEAEVEDASSRSFGDPEEDPTVPALTDSSEEDHFDVALNSVETDDGNIQAEQEEEEVKPTKARTSRSKVTSIPRYVEDAGEVHGEDVFAANLGEAQRNLPSTRGSSKIARRDQVAGKPLYGEAEGDDEDTVGQRKIPAAKRQTDPDSSHVEIEEMEIEPAGSIGKLASRARPRTSKVVKDEPKSVLRSYGENVWADGEVESDTPARSREDSSESDREPEDSMIEPAGRLGSLHPAKRNGSRQPGRLSRLQVPSADSEEEHDDGHDAPLAKSISKRNTRGGTISSARSRVKSELEEEEEPTDSFTDTTSSYNSDASIRPRSKVDEYPMAKSIAKTSSKESSRLGKKQVNEESDVEENSDDVETSSFVLPTKVARKSVGTQSGKRNSTATVESEDEANVLPSQRLRGRRSGRLGGAASAAKTYPSKTLVAQAEAQDEEHDLEPLEIESKPVVSRGKPSRARGTTAPQTLSVVQEEEAADPEDVSDSVGDHFTEEDSETAVSSPKARSNSLFRGKSKQARTSVEDVDVDIIDSKAAKIEKTGSEAVDTEVENEAEIDEGSQDPVSIEKSSLLADETDAGLSTHEDAVEEGTADASLLADETDAGLSTHEDGVEEGTVDADHSTVGDAEGAEETSDSEESRRTDQVPTQDAEEADSEDAKDVKQEGSQLSGEMADSEEVLKDSVLDVSEEVKPVDSEEAEVEHSDEADAETPEDAELQKPEETEPVLSEESESQKSIDEDSGNTDHLETSDTETVVQESDPESEQAETETDSPNGIDADEQAEARRAKGGMQASDSAEATEAEIEQQDTSPETDESSSESDKGETDEVLVEDTASEKQEVGNDDKAISDTEETKEGSEDVEASSIDTDGKPEEDEERLNPDVEVAPEEEEAAGATPVEETDQSDGSVEAESPGSESLLEEDNAVPPAPVEATEEADTATEAGSSEQPLLEPNSGNEEVPVGESTEESSSEQSPENQETTSDASKSSFKLAPRKKSPFARAAPEADEDTASNEATEMKASTKVRDRKAGSISRSATKEEGEAPASRSSRGASLRAERRAAWAKRRESSHSTTH
ncbi:hypothetical protein CYMTET_14923 [Cymbomonas tetramitiformis]|uniref:Uncharacterized protein n=1 Tax=Cymbomonas tetramitiformis TaxID=36881 RepID=A0AAE0GF29_9CHLO|nr:hypothetical protein CYMTET_14923 [Cymbomonas tetramitiformis]